MIRIIIGLLTALLFSLAAQAQSVQQSGKVTPRHGAMWTTNGVIQDAGGAAGGPVGTGLSELGITNTGCPFQINDGPTTAPYHFLNLCSNALGGGSINYGAAGGATPLPFSFSANGVVVPLVPTVSGTTLVHSTAALSALGTLSGPTVIKDGYTTVGDMPITDYRLINGVCSLNAGAGDGGYQIPSSDGNCWTANLLSVPDMRVWGPDITGASDASTKVQAAVNYVCTLATAKGGTLYFGPGKYKFHDVVANCDGFWVRGAGVGGNPGFRNTAVPAANATYFDCSGKTAFCIQWKASTFPSPRQLDGGGASDLVIVDTGSTGPALDLNQIQGGLVRDIVLYQPGTGIRVFGGFPTDLHNIQMWGVFNIGVEVVGDQSGFASGGGACTLGDCSTRADTTNMKHITMVAHSSSAVGVSLHEQVGDTEMSDVSMENGGTGLRVRCATGSPNISYCPEFIFAKNIEFEFTNAPLDLQDFTDFRCTQCYFFGNGASTTNTVTATLVNYTPAAGGGGGVVISDTTIVSANNDCAVLKVPDTQIVNSAVWGCNLSNLSFVGLHYDSFPKHQVSNTTFCDHLGVAATQFVPWQVDSGASYVQFANNNYLSCKSGTGLNNALTANQPTVREVNANPPQGSSAFSGFGHAVSITGASGLGSGGTAVVQGGSNDLGGLILLTAGSGAAATGSLEIDFGSPFYPQGSCFITPIDGSATWDSSWSYKTSSSLTTKNVFTWKNGAASLTGSGTYFLKWTCGGY